MPINFDASATYGAEVKSITLLPDGTATIVVKNTSAGNPVSEVEITVQADHGATTLHQRTGETGIVIPLDFADAIDAVIAKATSHLGAVIAADKHAL